MSSRTDTVDLAGLEPAVVWRLFAGIAATPNPSKREEPIRRHVRALAEKQGLQVREDSSGNLVIDVPAREGLERVGPTVLQAHLDMVCVKEATSDHDFDRDPIRVRVADDAGGDGVVVRADDTTLGADNGIGIAMALAVAQTPDAVHGPLELLFTVDEEAGMTGAKALEPQSFRARRLLNLDSEEDDALYIGCAGGCDSTLSWDLAVGPPDGHGECCRVAVSGLRGGHSGGDIHENRGNAIKLLVQTLQRAEVESFQVAELSGGSLRNAIPREASATVHGAVGLRAALQAAAEQVRSEAVSDSAEDNVSILVEEVPTCDASAVLSAKDTRRIIDCVAALPHGVLGMHPEVDALVETSNNVATVSSHVLDSGAGMHVEVGTLSRSSSASWLHATLDQIAAISRLAGATVETANEYPGWEPNVDSPLLATCQRVYERLFGAPPKVAAVHAGLECGIIAKCVGNMDAVSFGPRIEGAHSPEERVYVSSVQKSWKYLLTVLAELAQA
ncbi:MAG: beta-Ala-His dipeptidase [Planctomycetota bacterium]|jgi:dipeptidase D